MRVTLTVLWIALLSLALAVWDCGSLVFGDPLGVCGALGELDITAPESSGAVVAGVAALGWSLRGCLICVGCVDDAGISRSEHWSRISVDCPTPTAGT